MKKNHNGTKKIDEIPAIRFTFKCIKCFNELMGSIIMPTQVIWIEPCEECLKNNYVLPNAD